jgi:hypothetical protein
VTRDVEQTLSVPPAPLLKNVVVKQHEIFRDVRFTGELLVLIAAVSDDRGDKRHCGGEMLGRER